MIPASIFLWVISQSKMNMLPDYQPLENIKVPSPSRNT